MRPISGPGNVANTFADYDPVSNPLGTVYTAQWGNDVQDELLGIQAEMGVSTGAGSNRLVYASMLRAIKEYRLPVGGIIQSTVALTPTAFDVNNPETYEPVFDLQAGGTLNVANYPDYVPKLRSELVRVGSTTAFTGSASGSIITLDNNADNLAVLEALLEDQIFYSAYNRPITWGGSDFVITNINGVTRAITVTGTPTAGAGSATFHPYRIVGSTTTARILAHDGLVLATGGASGRVTGLVTRDRMQLIEGEYEMQRSTGSLASGAISLEDGAFSNATGGTGQTRKFIFSSQYAGQRTGSTTRERSLAVRLFAHVGRLL